jgi:hypothetical protein
MSQGMNFIDLMVHNDSYESKRIMLDFNLVVDWADISGAFMNVADNYNLFGSPDYSRDYTDIELQNLLPDRSHQDPDIGPFKSWRAVNPCVTRGVLMQNDFDRPGLHERAYIFWDVDRLDRYNMLESFDKVPEGRETFFKGSEYD